MKKAYLCYKKTLESISSKNQDKLRMQQLKIQQRRIKEKS